MSDIPTNFEIPDQVEIEAGPGEFSSVIVNGKHASARICLHGAHVTHYQQQGKKPVLWMSPTAVFQSDKAIRGGVPICWPWFGPHSEDSSLPQHGFVRTSQWRPTGSEIFPDGSVEIKMALQHSPESLAMWPHEFLLQMRIVVGQQLGLELTAQNCGPSSMVAGAALHTYFAVDDISSVRVVGFSDTPYLDQLDQHQQKIQSGDIRFDQEVDRIYLNAGSKVVIQTDENKPVAEINSSGSQSTVVWNPWIDKAKRMADFSDDGYQSMVCIETANAASDIRTIPPGESHTLKQTITPGATL